MSERTIFASSRNYSSTHRLRDACRKAGVSLSSRGEVIHGGAVVGTYELAGGVIVVRDIALDSPLIAALDLRQVG